MKKHLYIFTGILALAGLILFAGLQSASAAPSVGANYFANTLKFSTTTTGCLNGNTTSSGVVTTYFTGSDCGTGGGGGGVGTSTNPFMATYFVATSTTATSTFAAPINASLFQATGNGSLGNMAFGWSTDPDTGFIRTGSNMFAGVTNGVSRFSVSSTGNFNIGPTDTSLPAQVQILTNDTPVSSIIDLFQLSLDNTVGLGASVGSGIAIIWELQNDIMSGFEAFRQEVVATDVSSGSEDADLVWKMMTNGSAANEKMRLTSTGNVGIGTTSPYAKLSVVGEVVASHFTATSTTATSTMETGLAIETSGFVYDRSTNNVGIGTTSPTSKLTFAAGTTAATGILFGTDTNLYRSTANVLKTDDDISVGANVYLEGGAGRIYASGGLVNLSSANNARVRTTNGGTVVDRNIADTNVALTVTQLNSGSTGHILELRNNSATTTVFTQAGSLGVGTTTPWRTLSVVGTVAINGLSSATGGNAVCIGATTFDVQNAGNTTCVTSALRFKENIKDLVSGLSIDTLMKLRPVTFDYKEGYHGKNETAKSYGLIAEEVEKVDSTLVDYCDDGKVCTLHFEKITGLLVSAIQNVVARISGLEGKLEAQQKQIDAMQKKLDKLMK